MLNASDLRAENARLRDRVFALEDAIGMRGPTPRCLGLPPQEAAILAMLVRFGTVSRDRIMAALYGGRDDWPQEQIVGQLVFRLRHRLKLHSIDIRTVWGEGYVLTPQMQDRVRALMAAENGQEAA